MSSENPFAVPQGVNPPILANAADKLPTYAQVVVIIDLVLRILRMLLAIFSIVGIIAMGQQNPMYLWGILEIATGVSMVACGLSGDSLVLAKQRWGLVLCWIALLATIGNVVVGLFEVPLVWEAQVQSGKLPPGQENAVKIVMWVGAIMTSLFRFGLIIAYGIALVIAKRYFDRRAVAFTG